MAAYRRQLLIAAMAAALALTLRTGASPAAWYCEGRVCSVDQAACCCVADSGRMQDDSCGADRQSGADLGCPGRCDCTLVQTTIPQAIRVQASPLPDVSADSPLPELRTSAPTPLPAP